MSGPLVSVIMSMHNEQAYVERAIRSMLTQSMGELELIVIDDYSTDDSVQIVRGIVDPRIRLHVKTDEPRYLAASRNMGVEMARGQYITFQDADDASDRQRLGQQVGLARELGEGAVVGCWIRRICNGQERLCRLPARHEQIVAGFNRCWRRTTIVGGTILARRALLQAVPYRTRFRYMQDWDQLLRLYESRLARFANVCQPLYDYYIRPKGVLNRPEWLDCNIYLRHCQWSRRHHRQECESIEAFWDHLRRHPLQRARWQGLRTLIRGRNHLSHRLRKAMVGCLGRNHQAAGPTAGPGVPIRGGLPSIGKAMQQGAVQTSTRGAH